jgi:predicted dehydrogenase
MVNHIHIGIIGYGYWGPNLARNFSEIPGVQVKTISDLKPASLEKAHARYPHIPVTTDYRDVLADPHIDAVAIATPVSTHFDLAMEALQAGKHVLIEKPMTTSSEQAMRLIEEAEKRNLVLLSIIPLSIQARFVKCRS